MTTDDEYQSWKSQALCWQLVSMQICSPDLWFQDDFSYDSATAAAICFRCPVREACLKAACGNKEPFGIWGGLPSSIRGGKNHRRLLTLSNPYSTEDPSSPYHEGNLTEGDQDERE